MLNAVNELEKEKEIVVVRYSLSSMSYREKAFLLPKDTIII